MIGGIVLVLVIVAVVVVVFVLPGDGEDTVKELPEIKYQLAEQYTNIPVGDEDGNYKILKFQMTIVYTDEEYTELYPEFARIAEEEGFKKVATAFKLIAKVEKMHEQRYLKLLSNLEEEKVFVSEEKEEWYCRNCGYVHEGTKAPNMCAACEHPQSYFEKKSTNY